MSRLFALVLAALLPLAAAAQSYPSGPLRMIIPFPPGGPADLLGRAVAQGLHDAWGQPVVVDNRGGAGGQIGVDAGAKAAADGLTMVVVPVGNIAVAPALFPNLPYKPGDLAPVTNLATVENVLAVHPGVPAKTVQELIALAKTQPGKLTYGSPGAGSQAHLAGALMELETGVELTHVAYRGMAPAVADLLGGQITMMFASASSVIQHAQAGKLRALGVASLTRSAAAPDLPTVAEQGLPGFEAVSWYALMVPAGTPAPVIEKLAAEASRIVRRPENRESFGKQGMTPVGDRPADLARTIAQDTERWSDVIRRRRITVN